MKKILLLLLIFFLPVSAEAEGVIDYVNEYGIEELINYDLGIFEEFNLNDVQNKLISGEGFDELNIIKKFILIVFSEIKAYIKMFVMLLLCGFIIAVGTGAESLSSKSREVTKSVAYCIYAGMLCKIFIDITAPVKEYIEYICVAGKTLCTALIGITYAKGGMVTGLLMDSGLIVMLNMFLEVFVKVLIPLTVSSALISVAGNFSDRIKIGSLAKNLRGAAKWILGIVLSLYTGIFGIYGIAGTGIDITIRKAAKMAVGTALPVVGGVVADSIENIGAIMKGVGNIVGVSGIIIIIFYAVTPVVKMLVLRWGLKICISILEPVSSPEIVKVSDEICECITNMFGIFCAGLLLICSMVGILIFAGNEGF